MASHDLSLRQFIQHVKQELLASQYQAKGKPAFLLLKDVELEVSFAATRTKDGGVDLKVVQLGAELSSHETHSVKLTFGLPSEIVLTGQEVSPDYSIEAGVVATAQAVRSPTIQPGSPYFGTSQDPPKSISPKRSDAD